MTGDRHRVEDRVAEGPNWSAWRAIDTVLGRPVWILRVTAGHPHRAEVADAARSAAGVTDPGFLHIYDIEDPAGGDLEVVREWATGTTLADQLAAGPLPPEEACVIGVQVARSLASANDSGATHEAVGPGDIVITEDRRTKIAGLAVRAALEGSEGRRGDGWCAAAVTYAAATGRWPVGDRDSVPGAAPGTTGLDSIPRPRQVRAGVPKSLDRVLATALTRAEEGPADVGHSLESVLAGMGRRASDTAAMQPPRDPPSHRLWRRTITAVAVITLAVAALVGFLLTRSDGTADGSDPAAGAQPTSSPTTTAAPSLTPSPSESSQRIAVVGGEDFDPKGNGEENSALVELAFDGNLATAWRTVSYEQSDLAPKPGVGVLFDLGEVQNVGAVQMNLVGAGTSFEVRVSETLGDRRKDFQRFGSGTQVGDVVAVRSPTQVPARYVLVWLTELPPDGETYRGGISEITVARA